MVVESVNLEKLKSYKITKGLVSELMKIKAKCTGTTFLTDKKFILTQGTAKDLTNIEKQLNQWLKPFNKSIKYGEQATGVYYPVGIRMLSLLIIKDYFKMKPVQVRKIGVQAAKQSFITKLLVRMFVSTRKAAEKADYYWSLYYPDAKLTLKEFDEQKRTAIVTVKGMDYHPIFGHFLEGFMTQYLGLSLPASSKVETKEIKCPFKNKKFKEHEFKVTWT